MPSPLAVASSDFASCTAAAATRAAAAAAAAFAAGPCCKALLSPLIQLVVERSDAPYVFLAKCHVGARRGYRPLARVADGPTAVEPVPRRNALVAQRAVVERHAEPVCDLFDAAVKRFEGAPHVKVRTEGLEQLVQLGAARLGELGGGLRVKLARLLVGDEVRRAAAEDKPRLLARGGTELAEQRA